MWPGEVLAAASDAPANDSLIVVIGGIVVAAIGLLTAVLVEVVRGRGARTSTPAQPSTTISSTSVDVVALAADVAVLKDWRKTTREADDLHDRTVHGLVGDVEDLVRFNDREHPDWRP